MKRLVTVAALGLAAATSQYAGEARHMTLSEAVHLAIDQSRLLKIARLKVSESEERKAGERSAYFPSLKNESNILHVTDLQNISIPTGAFGNAGGAPVPSRETILPQGRDTFYTSGTQLSQPLTQLIRIRDANRIAAAEVAISRDELKQAENEVALRVHSLYYGVLITQLQRKAAEQQAQYASANLRESEENVRNGDALKVAAIQGQATVLESQQAVLTADLQLSDLTAELNDLLGLPLDTKLDLDDGVPTGFDSRSREEYVQTAWSQNPQIKAAAEAIAKAGAAVASAKTAYIPDITAYARQSYQDGLPFFVRNFGTLGVNMTWDLFDFGKRRAAVRERQDQLEEARENLRRSKDEIAVSIERSYNKVERTKNLVDVAQQVVKLRQESERLARNQSAQGVVLVSDHRQATAATYRAQADLLQANLGYLLAWAELQASAGITPGF
jgi:outer membrane protein TolC